MPPPDLSPLFKKKLKHFKGEVQNLSSSSSEYSKLSRKMTLEYAIIEYIYTNAIPKHKVSPNYCKFKVMLLTTFLKIGDISIIANNNKLYKALFASRARKVIAIFIV